MKEFSDGDKNIIRNLRYEFGDKIAHLTDEHILKNYNDYNLSDKSDSVLDWLLD